MRRAKAVVAVDDADPLEATQTFDDVIGRERSEPLQAGEADLVALFAKSSHDDPTGHRDGALTDQDIVGVVGHVLLDKRLLLAARQLVVLAIRLPNDSRRAAHRRIVLLADL